MAIHNSKMAILHGFIDIGSCGLHTIHNAFKTGAKKTDWKMKNILKAAYQIFHDSPVWRRLPYHHWLQSFSFNILCNKFGDFFPWFTKILCVTKYIDEISIYYLCTTACNLGSLIGFSNLKFNPSVFNLCFVCVTCNDMNIMVVDLMPLKPL